MITKIKTLKPNQAEAADYIAEITLNLRDMAERNGLQLTAYFLEMAHESAFDENKGVELMRNIRAKFEATH